MMIIYYKSKPVITIPENYTELHLSDDDILDLMKKVQYCAPREIEVDRLHAHLSKALETNQILAKEINENQI